MAWALQLRQKRGIWTASPAFNFWTREPLETFCRHGVQALPFHSSTDTLLFHLSCALCAFYGRPADSYWTWGKSVWALWKYWQSRQMFIMFLLPVALGWFGSAPCWSCAACFKDQLVLSAASRVGWGLLGGWESLSAGQSEMFGWLEHVTLRSGVRPTGPRKKQ